jgi:hypothetical protein
MLIFSSTKGNYHMKDWINHQIKLINANMSNVIIFPSERRQNQIEESERQKEKMRGDAPLIARSSDHLSKNSAFPPDYDGNPPNAA